jgi:hypothetical protein
MLTTPGGRSAFRPPQPAYTVSVLSRFDHNSISGMRGRIFHAIKRENLMGLSAHSAKVDTSCQETISICLTIPHSKEMSNGQ